jgi:hypothetical protein
VDSIGRYALHRGQWIVSKIVVTFSINPVALQAFNSAWMPLSFCKGALEIGLFFNELGRTISMFMVSFERLFERRHAQN